MSDEILGQVDGLIDLTYTIRFQLGTLDDFSWEDNHVKISKWTSLIDGPWLNRVN